MSAPVDVRIPLAGDVTLEGLLGERDPDAPAAVVCHPHPAFGGRMDNPLVGALAGALAAHGLATLRFNFRGVDGSGGAPTGGHAEHEDVEAALRFLAARGHRHLALVGYSFGALMGVRALARGTSAVAPVGAYAAVAFPTSIIGDDPVRNADVGRALDRGVPTLFIHGDADNLLDCAQIDGYAAGRAHVTVERLAGRGHFFAGHDEQVVCAAVATFVARALRL